MHDAFVGRDDDVGWLRHLLGRATVGEPAVALVVGEAGIGKTRLIDEALAAVDRAEVRVLRGDASEHDLTTFGLWQGVERGLGSVRPDPTLPPSERRWELLEHLVAGLATHPTVVVLEDLHWADEASIWVLERLPRELQGVPVAIVATSRPEEPGTERLARIRRDAGVRHLAGLDPAGLRALAEAVRPGSSADADDLHRRTAGNPLFARELLVADAEGGVPAAVADVLDRSLDRLDDDLRPVVMAVAVPAGPSAALSVLAAATGLEPLALEEHLDRAAGAGILRREAGRPVGFRHVLLAEAAVAAASARERSECRLRLADAWSTQFPSPVGAAEAANHRLAALPLGDPAEAASAALAAVEGLRSVGDLPRIVGLARGALAALDRVGSRGAPHVRLAAALADALDALGEGEPAAVAYQDARARVDGSTDPGLRAEVEIGAARFVNPFLPHLEQMQRLRAADAALPQGDSPTRVQLLSRLAVLQCSSPGGPLASRADGDAAVAMARRLGDPELLVWALIDRHLMPVTVEDWDAVGVAGEEVVALGEGMGRPDLAFLGHEVVFLDRLDRGDRDGAEDALARVEAYAEVLPSPRWRWTAAVRRSEHQLMEGDREGFRDAIDRGAEFGAGVGATIEVVGVDLGMRAVGAVAWGVDDPVLRVRHAEMIEQARHIPASFIQIMFAVDHLAFGDHDPVRAIVDRYALRPEAVLEQMQGTHALASLGHMVAEVGAVEHAARVHDALLPFRGRLGMVTMPIAATLGRLSLLLGDVPGALRHHHEALAMAERLRSPMLLAWGEHHRAQALEAAGRAEEAAAASAAAARHAARCGVHLPGADGATPMAAPVAVAPASRSGSMRRDGDTWVVRGPEGEARLADTTGIQQLGQLLAAGGAEIPATTLAGIDAVPVPVERDLGPALDATAKRQYRARIAELRADIDEAEANNDPDRAAIAQLELDAFLRELSAAVGIGGRDRPTGSGAEKARVNVTRNVRRAIATVAAELPALGAHLERSVRTGRFCAYQPEPATALTWEVAV